MFIRAAAAGLGGERHQHADARSGAPPTPSSQRSMVHHQTPSGGRSERAKAWAGADDGGRHARTPLRLRRLFGVSRFASRRDGPDGGAERLAPLLEVGELVERGAGRRQQDDRLLARGDGVGEGGLATAVSMVAALHGRGLALQRLGRSPRRGLADQVGACSTAREQVGQVVDAARLGARRRRSSRIWDSTTSPGGRRRRWWPCCR